MKKSVLLTLILSFFILSMPNFCHAFDVDKTVDDEIRKNYNPSKLMNDVGISDTALEKTIEADKITPDTNLPALPNITKQQSVKKESDIKSGSIVAQTTTVPYRGGNIRVKDGTSFEVVSNAAISDWQRKGTVVKFTSKTPTYGKGFTIPAGTIFTGEITESHQPQISCNGGLVAIEVTSMRYKNQNVPINAYITNANNKKVFLNNIKGKRTYLKTVWEKGNWGRTIFGRMCNLTVNLGGEGSTLILSPFPFAYGTLCLGVNAITSPITAFFSKGGHVSIPAGSRFRLKLFEDAMID